MTTTVEKPKHFVQREGGEFQREQFKIASSQEAFRILSDGLYSDKIRAVVRELSTNANDSHIIAKIDDVFEVHLPTYDEPWFRVRDFGTGMSHEDVMDLYSTYFGTNKAEELETTGCLGLGSKSPLSKVRSFTVISRFDGTERHYIVALNEERIPEVNYLPEQDAPTTDTGMEIQMAVDIGDIRTYSRKAGQVYRYFDPKCRPRVINGENYDIPEPEVLIEGEGWRMLKGDGTPIAIMGNVGYPLAASQVDELSPQHQAVLSCNLEIDFPVGSLSFTPSREHLSYNRKTIAVIKERLDEIVSEVNETIGKRFEACETLWEARMLAWQIFWSSSADLRHLVKLADTGQITWKGEKIAGRKLSFDEEAPHTKVFEFAIKNKTRGRYYDQTVVGKTVGRTDRKEITPKEGIVWMEVDIPRGSYSRCQEYVRANEEAIIYLVDFATPEGRVAFCEKIGLAGGEFVQTSTLPKPAVNRKSGGTLHRSSSLVYKHKGRTSASRLYEYWEQTEIDLDGGEGGVYVEMKNNKAVGPKGYCVNPGEVGEVMNLINRIVGDDEKIEVIGVRPQVAKRFRKSDDWVDIWTYAQKIVQIQMIKKGLERHIVNAEAWDKMADQDLWDSFIKRKKKLGVFSSTGATQKFFDDMEFMRAASGKCPRYVEWRQLAGLCKVEIAGKPERNLKQAVKDILAALPMLEMIHNLKNERWNAKHWKDAEVAQMGDYLRLIESQQKDG